MKSTNVYTAELIERRWLAERTVELTLVRPPAFAFSPGQHIRLLHQDLHRDYSLISAPADPQLSFCLRQVAEGELSPWLAQLPLKSSLRFSGPQGYFTFRPSPRPAVLVATGTGVAPFVSMARSGLTGFTLLHGVETPSHLYYQSRLRAAAGRYVPCLSNTPADAPAPPDSFRGRVTQCLSTGLTPGSYDFYLCGRSDMIREVTFLVDDHFPDSRVYTEIFY